MSQKVKVYNSDTKEYREHSVILDKKIVVPAQGSVEMTRHEANAFLGTYSGNDKEGNPKPKKLSIVQLEGAAPEVEHVCNLCNFKADSAEQLDKHLSTHKDDPRKVAAEFKEQEPTPESTMVMKALEKIADSIGQLSSRMDKFEADKPEASRAKRGRPLNRGENANTNTGLRSSP